MDRPLTLPWLLVATPQLQDQNFSRTVVLVVEHGSQGSMGFVINRPIRASLADLVTMPNVAIPTNVPAWYGGPVERSTGIILHNQHAQRREPKQAGRGTDAAYQGLALSSSEQTLVDMVDYSVRRSAELTARPPVPQGAEGQLSPEEGLYPYRFLVGYAGWGQGQLTEELHQGAWIQAPATQELLFNTPWKTLWDAALGAIGVNPRALAPSAHQYLN